MPRSATVNVAPASWSWAPGASDASAEIGGAATSGRSSVKYSRPWASEIHAHCPPSSLAYHSCHTPPPGWRSCAMPISRNPAEP